jgi:hypothetical protein
MPAKGKIDCIFLLPALPPHFFNGKTKKDEEDFFSTTVFELSFSFLPIEANQE